MWKTLFWTLVRVRPLSSARFFKTFFYDLERFQTLLVRTFLTARTCLGAETLKNGFYDLERFQTLLVRTFLTARTCFGAGTLRQAAIRPAADRL